MILVAGGTGLLGRQVVARLVSRNVPVRVLTRDAAHAAGALGSLADHVEIVTGDVRDRASLAPAVAGADTVVAAVQGFGGRDAGGLGAVDRDGNLNLVRVSAAARVSQFLLLSIHDATPADPLALGRVKAAVEAELRTTAMIPILVRPTAYMETWAGIVGGPILASGKARIFGRGRNPINFVSAADVAEVVDAELARIVAAASQTSSRTIEVVGPEDLSFEAIVDAFAGALGRQVPAAHVPLPMLRAMALALRPFKPVLADQIAAAVVLDTTDRRAATAPTDAERTVVRGKTTFNEVIHNMVAAQPLGETVPTRA
jgi:uncharacterized protein YbjT (DUF2867 family)